MKQTKNKKMKPNTLVKALLMPGVVESLIFTFIDQSPQDS